MKLKDLIGRTFMITFEHKDVEEKRACFHNYQLGDAATGNNRFTLIEIDGEVILHIKTDNPLYTKQAKIAVYDFLYRS